MNSNGTGPSTIFQNVYKCHFIAVMLSINSRCDNSSRNSCGLPVKKIRTVRLILPRLRSKPKFSSDQTFQTQVTSDQTFQTEKVSDQTFQTDGALIRPSSDHGPDSNTDHCPDLNQTMIRLKCARRGYDQTQLRSKHLLSDQVALAAIYDQTEARSKPVAIKAMGL